MVNTQTLELKITPLEASRIMGCSPEFIRAGLRAERFDWGYAVQGKTGRWTYYIIKSKFYEAMGISDQINT